MNRRLPRPLDSGGLFVDNLYLQVKVDGMERARGNFPPDTSTFSCWESVREVVISPPRAILESWQASSFGLALSRNSLTPTLVLCLPLSFLNTSWWNIFCSMEVYFKNNITYIHSSLETWLKHWEDVRLSCGLGGLRRIINILLWALTPQLRKGYRTVDQAIDEIYLKFKTIL